MTKDSSVQGGKTIRILEGTYDRLEKLGTVSQSFDDVVKKLLDFYEDNALQSERSKSIDTLIERLQFPVDDRVRDMIIDFVSYILKLGDDVTYSLFMDKFHSTPMKGKKNAGIFYKQCIPFVQIKSDNGGFSCYRSVEPDEFNRGWGFIEHISPDRDVKEMGNVKEIIRCDYGHII